MGIWKFVERVSNKELIDVADQWAKDPKYIQLYIRGSGSGGQMGIGFAYESDGTKEAQEKYFADTSDFLKRHFGNDLRGWDIASTSQLIKGF